MTLLLPIQNSLKPLHFKYPEYYQITIISDEQQHFTMIGTGRTPKISFLLLSIICNMCNNVGVKQHGMWDIFCVGCIYLRLTLLLKHTSVKYKCSRFHYFYQKYTIVSWFILL